MKHLKIHKFPFKNVIVLAIECKMYLKIQQKLRWLGCISKQTMGSVVKKTRLNSSKDNFLMKSFPLSTKRKLRTFSFHFLSFNGVFLTLKCGTLVLKHLHGDRAAAILLKMDIRHYGFQIWSKWIFTSIERELHVSTPYGFLMPSNDENSDESMTSQDMFNG